MGSGYFYSRKCLKVIWEGADCSLKGEKNKMEGGVLGVDIKKEEVDTECKPSWKDRVRPGQAWRNQAAGIWSAWCLSWGCTCYLRHAWGFPQKLSWGCKFKQIFKNIYG